MYNSKGLLTKDDDDKIRLPTETTRSMCYRVIWRRPSPLKHFLHKYTLTICLTELNLTKAVNKLTLRKTDVLSYLPAASRPVRLPLVQQSGVARPIIVCKHFFLCLSTYLSVSNIVTSFLITCSAQYAETGGQPSHLSISFFDNILISHDDHSKRNFGKVREPSMTRR